MTDPVTLEPDVNRNDVVYSTGTEKVEYDHTVFGPLKWVVFGRLNTSVAWRWIAECATCEEAIAIAKDPERMDLEESLSEIDRRKRRSALNQLLENAEKVKHGTVTEAASETIESKSVQGEVEKVLSVGESLSPSTSAAEPRETRKPILPLDTDSAIKAERSDADVRAVAPSADA